LHRLRHLGQPAFGELDAARCGTAIAASDDVTLRASVSGASRDDRTVRLTDVIACDVDIG